MYPNANLYQAKAGPWGYGIGPLGIPATVSPLTDHCHTGQTLIPARTEVKQGAESPVKAERNAPERAQVSKAIPFMPTDSSVMHVGPASL